MRGRIRVIPKNDKHKEYVRYGNYCLEMATVAGNQDTRAIQREMAAEWLNLARMLLSIRPAR